MSHSPMKSTERLLMEDMVMDVALEELPNFIDRVEGSKINFDIVGRGSKEEPFTFRARNAIKKSAKNEMKAAITATTSEPPNLLQMIRFVANDRSLIRTEEVQHLFIFVVQHSNDLRLDEIGKEIQGLLASKDSSKIAIITLGKGGVQDRYLNDIQKNMKEDVKKRVYAKHVTTATALNQSLNKIWRMHCGGEKDTLQTSSLETGGVSSKKDSRILIAFDACNGLKSVQFDLKEQVEAEKTPWWSCLCN